MLTRTPVPSALEPLGSPGPNGLRIEKASGLTSSVGHILWACALFNLALCFLDTHALRVSSIHVILAEAAILGAALLLPIIRTARAPGRMDALLIVLFASWLLLSIARQSVDPKFFRDVAIIPVFVLLGLVSTGNCLHRQIFWLHMLILGGAIWEAFSPGSFVRVFAVADYFNSTRGTDSSEWWVDSGFYISAVRPESRFLIEGLPLHRLSSIFLEPVSLGNYVVVATVWLAGFWREIPARMRLPGAIATVLLLIGSDSRMATLTCLAILLALPFRRQIPSLAPLLTAPLVLLTLFLAVWLLDLQTGLDNFEGRIAHAANVFRAFSVENYLGLSTDLMKQSEDAGFAYIVMTQSIFVAVLIWVSLFLRRNATPEARFVHLAIALYVSLNLTVSWSLFSIKTAALLWVLLGRAVRDDVEQSATLASMPVHRRLTRLHPLRKAQP